jgi:hypothetical protein
MKANHLYSDAIRKRDHSLTKFVHLKTELVRIQLFTKQILIATGIESVLQSYMGKVTKLKDKC